MRRKQVLIIFDVPYLAATFSEGQLPMMAMARSWELGLGPWEKTVSGGQRKQKSFWWWVENGGKQWRLKGGKYTACFLIKPLPEF